VPKSTELSDKVAKLIARLHAVDPADSLALEDVLDVLMKSADFGLTDAEHSAISKEASRVTLKVEEHLREAKKKP
jgi:hypothetical protein